MVTLTLVEVGEVAAAPLRSLPPVVGLATGLAVVVAAQRIDPAFALNPQRDQLDTRRLMPVLADTVPHGLVLGIADADLYSAVFTFVFGEAQLGGRVGLVSMHRLRPEVYGLAPDPIRLQERLLREVMHETGHLLGLIHCHAPACVMGFSGTVEEIDDKAQDFCDPCLEQVAQERSRRERSVASNRDAEAASDRSVDQGA